MTLCTVLIPTWNAPDTVGAAIHSALRQTVDDLEVLCVGDGVTQANRDVIVQCASEDSRVRFIDLPKGENRGERNRHAGLLEARAPVVAYLADDDLLLPRHVANMLELLEDVDFCQSRNGFIDREGLVSLWPTQLAEQRWRDWHLLDPPRNRVSITGTAHRVSTYKRLNPGWDVAPTGMWTDLFLWRQFFELEGLRAATHPQMTTIQFPAAARRTMNDVQVREQRAHWEAFIARRDAQSQLDDLVEDARRRHEVEWSATITNLEIALKERAEEIALERATREALETEGEISVTRLTQERDAALVHAAALQGQIRERDAHIAELYNSTSWRATRPLRKLSSLLRRGESR